MEGGSRIAQIYGYAVCLIAVITFIISAKGIVDAGFNLSDPLRAEGGYGRGGPLTSFEAYKREQRMRTPPRMRPVGTMAPTRVDAPTAADSVPPPTEAELRRMFDEEKADMTANVRFRSTRTLVTSSLMILIALGLFLMHWRWLRRQSTVG
ncbi:MAG TPA: hypothetical protein VIF83_15275 [Gemmatimonadaceae bacterium]|jgi:hypothetical protein